MASDEIPVGLRFDPPNQNMDLVRALRFLTIDRDLRELLVKLANEVDAERDARVRAEKERDEARDGFDATKKMLFDEVSRATAAEAKLTEVEDSRTYWKDAFWKERERAVATEASLATATEALRWYAAPENWNMIQIVGPDGDYGNRARTALSTIEAGTVEHPDSRWPLGTRVRKIKGSSWQGRVVGYYSTALTPLGYAVESEREPGNVQIYPAAALEIVQEPNANG